MLLRYLKNFLEGEAIINGTGRGAEQLEPFPLVVIRHAESVGELSRWYLSNE